jgi:hypothetical protein
MGACFFNYYSPGVRVSTPADSVLPTGVHDMICMGAVHPGRLLNQITHFPERNFQRGPGMAKNKKATSQVAKELAYVKGVAKNLVDRIYGPAGLPWGTKFTELEETVSAIREALSEEMFQQALARQAAQEERPAEYAACPGCGRPGGAAEGEPRRLETGGGDAVWMEPKTRCQKCRRDFFPSEQEPGN